MSHNFFSSDVNNLFASSRPPIDGSACSDMNDMQSSRPFIDGSILQ